ncbi:MAG: ABC transporter permease [Acutalibacteraceae bacterium]
MFSIFKEHRHFGRQIFMLAKNELIKTYKGAVIGPLWAAVKPLFTLFVYWFAFVVGLRSAGNVAVELHGATVEFDRFIFMLVGFIPWFFMSDCILQGSKCIRQNRQFVTKVSFPVSTIMTYTTVSKLFVHLFLTALMYIYILFAVGPSIYNLQFFLYCPLMFAFFLVLSWSTAPMCAFSLDFQNAINSIMTGLFWLSGILYNSYDMPANLGWLEKLMLFNPINFFANGYRNVFIYNKWFFEDPLELGIFFAELVVLFVLGLFNYKRLRKKLADVL